MLAVTHAAVTRGRERPTLEVREASFNLEYVIRTEVQNIIVLRFKVTSGPGAGSVDVGGPSGRKGSATIRVEGLKPLDPVLEYLEGRYPRDVWSVCFIHRLLVSVESGRLAEGESVTHGLVGLRG